MLRCRVIPLVLLDGYSVVKTVKFDVRRNLGNPIVVAKIYNARNVDELILLDIDASKENRKIDLRTVEAVTSECFMPLTVGGGLKTCGDIADALKAGADKVALNTVLFEKKELFNEAVSVFGSQCIVASIDVKKDDSGKYVLYSHSGKASGLTLDGCLEFLMRSKVGEILLNNVDLDGVMGGFDLELIHRVSKAASIPVIASGGASAPRDCAEAVKAGASAVAAASMFHFTSFTPRLCKEEMERCGIPVRL